MTLPAMLRKTGLTPKMLLLTLVVGVAAWVPLDAFQTRAVRGLFLDQLNGRLKEQAGLDRQIFDHYVSSYRHLVKVIGSQQQFAAYVESARRQNWSRADGVEVRYYRNAPPSWLPSRSVLRSFAHIRYALLLDGRNRARECYMSMAEPPPATLLEPGDLINQLSHNQNAIIELDDRPYLLASHFVGNGGTGHQATLLLASPIDTVFLIDAMGNFRVNHPIALANDKSIIIASTRPDILAEGTRLASLEKDYLITGKSFFDYGTSRLAVQFASLLTKSEYEALSSAILRQERGNRAITALAFLLVFTAIVFWMTRRIGGVTRQIVNLSRHSLGLETAPCRTGDELKTLEESFQVFAKEILASRQLLIEEKQLLEEAQSELQAKNIEVEHNRQNLQQALDEVSSLISRVATAKDFKVRFENQNLPHCDAIMKCTREGCPCYGRSDVRCWQMHADVYCRDVEEAFHGQHGNCFDCPVFKAATADPIYTIGEQFNNMMHILELKNKELENAYKELKSTQAQMLQQEKMASIGVLAAGVAHEINNPVGYIASNISTFGRYLERVREYLALLQEAADAYVTDEQTLRGLADKRNQLKIDYLLADGMNLVEESLEGTERVKSIVNNLKSFARVDEAEFKEADINECIESALNIVWNELKYKATVEKEYGHLPPLPCFPQQLNQVFMNLLINAAHAIEGQGTIRIRTWQEADAVLASIEDSGSGIAPNVASRIFDPFFTTKEVGKGTGLGLSISYDIIKQHNGKISVESEPGRGTTFTVRLPLG